MITYVGGRRGQVEEGHAAGDLEAPGGRVEGWQADASARRDKAQVVKSYFLSTNY